LRKLLENCWDKNPKNRPSFSEVIKRIDEVICDVTISDPVGNHFWKKHFLEKDRVLYSEFIGHFAEEILHLKVTDDVNFECLKNLLPTKDFDPTKKDPPLVVSVERFGLFLSLFGPLSEKVSILEKIKLIMKQPWFHGDLTSQEAERLLVNQKPGYFLVRLSSSPGFFTISKVSRENKINHQRIEYKFDKGFTVAVQTKKGKKIITENCSLQHYIDIIKSDLYLKAPCPGSPFEFIFCKIKSTLDGYLMCDSDNDD